MAFSPRERDDLPRLRVLLVLLRGWSDERFGDGGDDDDADRAGDAADGVLIVACGG